MNLSRTIAFVTIALALLGHNSVAALSAADPIEAAMGRMRQFLYRHQKGDGSWEPRERGNTEHYGHTTGLVAYALLESGESFQGPRMSRALAFIQEQASTGLHWERVPQPAANEPALRGVPSVGYQVRWRDQVWLFPGDVRTYDPTPLLHLRSPDVLFSHVWLGRSAAAQVRPPLLEQMVSFIAELAPRKRVILTHLYETSRQPQECWSTWHAQQVAQKLRERQPNLDVRYPLMGEVVLL